MESALSKSGFLSRLRQRAAAPAPRRIVLCEGEDPRVAEAAVECHRLGFARPQLVGSREAVLERLSELGAADSPGIDILDPSDSEHSGQLADEYHALRKSKGLSRDEAMEAIQAPHVFAALMTRLGFSDGMVGGAVTATADIVRAALQVVGPAPGTRLVSSFFLMLLYEPHHARKGALVFADCGLVIDPSPDELARIALDSAASFSSLAGEAPRVAMLSFSSFGSASHPSVDKVRRAVEAARSQDPGILVDGEMQFDAAFDPGVARAKRAGFEGPGPALEGDANVFIFPNLDAGNIGYKIAQRIGGATAIGPVLQGLAKPVNDLSRGCDSEDVLNMIAVTGIQAGAG